MNARLRQRSSRCKYVSRHVHKWLIYYYSCQVVRFSHIDFYVYCFPPELVNIAVAVDNVTVPCPSHDLRWNLDVPLFNENFDSSVHHSSAPLSRVFQVEFVDALKPFLFDSVVNLIFENCCRGVGTSRICGRVNGIKYYFVHQVKALKKVLFRLSGKPHNNIGSNCSIWYFLQP